MRTVARLAIVAALGFAAADARADEKQACLGAYERAQQLRMDAKLRAAREQLALCARPECPTLVRQDCSQWMTEVVQSMPSVVIAARDAQGRDILDVRVSIDGANVASRLDGKPVLVDPGPHKMKYETPGQAPIEEQVLVREGEHNRGLTVVFKQLNAQPVSATPVKEPHDEPEHEKPGPPVFAYTLIGIGTVALGAALYFDLKANGDAQTLRSTCAPNCKQSDVDAVQAKYLAAGVSLGVGVAGVGLGTVLLIVRALNKPDTQTTQTSWTFDAGPTRGGAAASVGAHF